MQETKPAIRTSEFWVHNIAMLATVLNVVGAWNFVPNQTIVLFQGVVTALYLLSRGIAKNGQPFNPDGPKV